MQGTRGTRAAAVAAAAGPDRSRGGSPRRRGRLVAALLLCGLAAPGSAGANAVVDWNATMSRFTASPRTHAMVHVAIHDALNAIDRRYEPYAVDLRAPRDASPEAAVAAAAHDTLARTLPVGARPANDAAYASYLQRIPDGEAKEEGIALGAHVAAEIVRLRDGDGFGRPYTYLGSDAPGAWRPTPPAFQAGLGTDQGRAKPFVLHSADQFGVEPPPELTSEQYTRDFLEVKAIGAVDSPRTPEQTQIARAWWTSTLVLVDLWLRAIAVNEGTDLWDSGRLFAGAMVAAADAGAIATFHFKYLYGFWRPVTAIQLAAEDGNPATPPDPAWKPMFDTPAFPEYPSGHCAGTGAVIEVIRQFFGTNRIRFAFVSPAAPGFVRQIENLQQVNEDCINARVWEGVHFRTGDEVAESLGRRIGHYTFHRAMRAAPGHVFRGAWRGGEAHQDDAVDPADHVE